MLGPPRWLLSGLPEFVERIKIISISGSLDKDNVAADPPRRLAIRGSARARARVLLLLRAGVARGAPFARFLALSSAHASRARV